MPEQSILVYVVDDDGSVRKALKRLMESAGLDVETFASAEDLLKAEIRPVGSCVVADVRMPGLTGLELQQQLKARGIRVPVVFLSAHDDEQLREQARDLGAVGFFHKPVDDQALLDVLFWVARAGALVEHPRPA